MPHHHRKTLRERIVPFTAAAVALGAVLTFSQLSAGIGGASAAPDNRAVKAASAASSDTVAVNRDAAATLAYWTKARTANAQELVPTRDDAGDASFGSSGLDFTRSRITPTSANRVAPYKTTGKLFFSNTSGGNFQCSASVIANRVAITAAHCIHSGSSFFTNFVFIPGYDGTQSTLALQRPFGTWAWSSAQIPVNWINTGGSLPNATDFGAIVFHDQAFNGVTMKLAQKAGKYTFSTGHLFDNHVTMLGYPCNFDSCNIMQRVDSSDHRVPPNYTGGNAYEYGSDMTGGSSGGPWLENFGTGAVPQGGWTVRNSVVAVTSYIYLDNGASLVEGASQLDSRWVTVYNGRCAANPGNC